MKVISDTSPIINLACVGQLELVHQLYGAILIPRAVYDEITRFGPEEPGAAEVQKLEWINVYNVTNRPLVEALELEVDPGEAEAIACTLELNADQLLLDEHIGRAVAKHLGLRVIGLLGVLIKAKREELISSVKPVLDDLILKAGFWISKPLYARVLEAVSETHEQPE